MAGVGGTPYVSFVSIDSPLVRPCRTAHSYRPRNDSAKLVTDAAPTSVAMATGAARRGYGGCRS